MARLSIGVSESTKEEPLPAFRHDSTYFKRFPDTIPEAIVEAFLNLVTQCKKSGWKCDRAQFCHRLANGSCQFEDSTIHVLQLPRA